MKLLHTSDLHLGRILHDAPLIEYQRQMLDRLCDIAENNNVDALLICGDIFDRAVPSPEAVGSWSDFVSRLCGHLGIKAYVIAGNHDGGIRLAQCSELLSQGGLYIVGTLPQSGLTSIECGNTVIHLMPYYTPDDVRAIFGGEINGWTQAHEAMAKAARSAIVEGKYNILVTHCYAMGASSSDSERAASAQGGLSAVDASLFDGFDYVAAGHLHRRQSVGGVHYCGTPLCYSFAEAADGKSVTIVDTDTKSTEFIPIDQPYRLTTLNGTMDEISEMPPSNDFIRCEVTSGYNGYASLELLKAMFPSLLVVNVKGGEDSDIEIAYKGGEVTPEQLLRGYAEDTGMELDDDLVRWFVETAEKAERDLGGEER